MTQAAPMKFAPNTGFAYDPPPPCTAPEFRERYPRFLWRFDPWTGGRRSIREIEADPLGLLIVPPGETVQAAPRSIDDARPEEWDAAAAAVRQPATAGDSHEALTFRPLPPVSPTERVSEPASPADTKPTNPKDGIGSLKVPLHLVSPIVKAYQAVAHFLGNVKYGAWNWRPAGARASVYYSALQRHMDRWWEGEEFDPVDGTPHLANAQACINILIEAKETGVLVDDRPPSRREDLQRVYAMVESQMAEIRRHYADKAPRHYTIADTEVRL